jgi:hypothetical protein
MRSHKRSLVVISILVGLVVSLLLAGTLEPADAQTRYVVLDGRVQWIAGQTMMLIPDGGLPINVDLSRVPQGEYATLTQGNRVVVSGVSSDGRRVLATAVAPAVG